MKKNKSFTIIIVILLLAVGVFVSTEASAGKLSYKVLSTNEDFIDGLHTKTETIDAKQVFAAVFSNLEDEVTIYPSENYYYFEMIMQGKLIKGNIGLTVDFRERGEITVGYDEVNAFAEIDADLGGAAILSEKDGVKITKINPFRYALTFAGKTVFFNLNQIEQKPSEKARLIGDEIFVGRSLDESGLKFFLIFNRKYNHFLWLLDEENALPETFNRIDPEIRIGSRTAFAFYDDAENNRKILIGVSKNERDKNTWYDGPFDQLPDNYIAADQIEIKKYIELAYPYAKGNVNKFGIFLDEPESRVAVAPYAAYAASSDLARIIGGARKSAGDDKSLFYREITRER